MYLMAAEKLTQPSVIETQRMSDHVHPNQLQGSYLVEKCVPSPDSNQVLCTYTAKWGETQYPDTTAWVHLRHIIFSSVYPQTTLEVDEDGRYALFIPENSPEFHVLSLMIRYARVDRG